MTRRVSLCVHRLGLSQRSQMHAKAAAEVIDSAESPTVNSSSWSRAGNIESQVRINAVTSCKGGGSARIGRYPKADAANRIVQIWNAFFRFFLSVITVLIVALSHR
ncbi:hypothetical protein PILCRDRAFT_246527 [Piloderma croceum F 1598]|uniref:Uncharacterized protein n=1 Tax=Piloderma croceum (strain F 1598) TaxID=765440 RepID=A0A0C3CGT8_PILCF|nr:hypothetical protein PILCRDRAFT_246527 [Piloderma croceum F 1598]